MRFSFAALVTGLLIASSAVADEWQLYTNAASGFTIDLPLSRFDVEQETSGRLTLHEVNGDVQLDVFGVTNPQQLTVAQFEAMMEAADPSRRITYRAGGRSWFVLSGYLKDLSEPTVFYAKFMLNRAGTALSAFEISYPATRKAELDPVVERIEDSLTAPR